MIPVARPYLPDIRRVQGYLEEADAQGRLSNDGPLVQRLARRLEAHLGVENLVLVANGTLALQIAYRAMAIGGTSETPAEAVTTPFTFVATANSLQWEG